MRTPQSIEHKTMLCNLVLALLFVLQLLHLFGCSHVTGKAGPDGKIMEISYWQFLRSYELRIEETEKGRVIRVGAESEIEKTAGLLGAVVGAAAALQAGGVVP